ncbi:3-hydroxyacyl-ACP dehydratase FabZ [Kangiella sp.]|uniref:3-hydroxyacyl-ACP dehydratase FabZ n=1 Tax=Kangiella sp. TaxID=1920245 RepID=UPI003A8DD042
MSDNNETEMNSMDIYEVMKHLPHRYPFLLVDRVVDFKAGEYLKAIKNVTVNEPFFPGHFPHRPVFPGVLMLEAMAQASGILAFKTTESLPSDDSLFYFVGIDDARFKKPVEPGDQVVMEVTVLKRKRDMWKFSAVATVDGKVVCSAELMCAKKDIV